MAIHPEIIPGYLDKAGKGGIWLSIPGYFDKGGGGHMAVHRRIIPGWPSYLRIPGYLDKGGGIWLSILG